MWDVIPQEEDRVRFKMRHATVAALAIVLLAGQIAAGNQGDPSTSSANGSIDCIVEQRMQEAGIVGLGAAIIVNRKLVWMKGYGYADKQREVPFTPNTIMNIGSITKTFTGVALMRAVQEGKLALDEDINRYLPFKVVNPYFPEARITLRQLATHTSSITDRSSVYGGTYHYGGDSPEPLGEFLKSYFTSSGRYHSKENFLNARPGAQYEYSNIAAGLAGYIVEIAVGEKLNVYTRRHIFAPLKMDSTGWFLSEISLANHSKLYVAQGGLTTPIELYGGTTYPDGGVRTSVADLSRFFIALLNEGEYEGARLLEKQSVEEMLRLQFTDAKKPDNINLKEKNSGIFWATKRDVTRIGHAGTDPGVKTEMLSDLSKEIGVILFTNTSQCDHEFRKFFEISDDLWKYAATLNGAPTKN
jgi:CubicO group peptidase (beta-lactamase class C family)